MTPVVFVSATLLNENCKVPPIQWLPVDYSEISIAFTAPLLGISFIKDSNFCSFSPRTRKLSDASNSSRQSRTQLVLAPDTHTPRGWLQALGRNQFTVRYRTLSVLHIDFRVSSSLTSSQSETARTHACARRSNGERCCFYHSKSQIMVPIFRCVAGLG